jgi:hypothetical protein
MKPWRSQEWCIPPEGNAEFVAAMEDILAVYTRKRDKKRPLVCMDKCPKQLIGEVRTPLPCGKGTTTKYDTEYARNGTCELFMFAAPLEGWRRASPREHRRRGDWAHEIRHLVDVDFPEHRFFPLFLFVRQMPVFNPRMGTDPLIAGINPRRQIFVAHPFCQHSPPGPNNFKCHRFSMTNFLYLSYS